MFSAKKNISNYKEQKHTNKDLNIESLRGIAIVLMVLGHVISHNITTSLTVKEDSLLRFMYYAFQYVRMPLFTIISGYVYAFKPLNRFPSTKGFMSRKTERLLIPFVIVTTLLYITRYVIPGLRLKVEIDDLWRTYLFPPLQFWYIQGMFIMFVIFVFLEKMKLLETLIRCQIVLAICVILFFFHPTTTLLSLNKVPFILIFFIVGVVFKRFKPVVFTKKIALTSTIVLCISLLFQMAMFNKNNTSELIPSLLTLIVGTTSSLLLIHSGFSNRRLIWLGNFSYGIYLFHMFSVAAFRILMIKLLDIDNIVINIVGGLMCGLAFPVILQLLIPRNSLLSLLFFGYKIDFKNGKAGDACGTRTVTYAQMN
jgi:glucan biosynthesis protein C